jgi:hypothetical protein
MVESALRATADAFRAVRYVKRALREDVLGDVENFVGCG